MFKTWELLSHHDNIKKVKFYHRILNRLLSVLSWARVEGSCLWARSARDSGSPWGTSRTASLFTFRHFEPRNHLTFLVLPPNHPNRFWNFYEKMVKKRIIRKVEPVDLDALHHSCGFNVIHHLKDLEGNLNDKIKNRSQFSWEKFLIFGTRL